MVSKCRAPVSEIAVMEVDVRPRTTRSPPADLDHVSSSSSNKRKNLAAAPDFDFSTTTTTTTTSFFKLQSRRRRLVLPENSFSTPPIMEEITTATKPTSDGSASAFNCCSSNGCSDVVDESLKFVDLEDEKDEHGLVYKSSRERREPSTPSSQFRSTQSGAMDSPAGKSEETSGNRSLLSSSGAKMPAGSELEEFFITAEKNIQKRFAEKYNYDIVEDVPTEGRYEWIRLKP